MTPVQITRNQMAVGRVQLVGGRFDGRTLFAVIGAPVTIPVNGKKKAAESGSGWANIVFRPFSDMVDGEAWKQGGKPDAPPPPPKRVEVYAPRFVDGKPTPLADFVEELAFTLESK